MGTLSCKPSLIDLEAWEQVTRRKRKQRERLSERASLGMMRQSELFYNKRRKREESRRAEYSPSQDGVTKCAGKYIPVPLEYGNPQGRSHSFANAQNQQTASQVISYFVYAIQDYQLVNRCPAFEESYAA